jgi:hypothetical protein
MMSDAENSGNIGLQREELSVEHCLACSMLSGTLAGADAADLVSEMANIELLMMMFDLAPVDRQIIAGLRILHKMAEQAEEDECVSADDSASSLH